MLHARVFPSPQWRAVTLVLLVSLIVAWFHPDEVEARHYSRILDNRKETDDEELFNRYFNSAAMAPDIPGRVRRIFAKHMYYAADKMLPDDDLNFFWNEADLEDVILDLQADFEIKIMSEDLTPPCTIRTFCNLVQLKCAHTRVVSQ